MHTDTLIALLSFGGYAVGMVAYVSVRFSKLETEVKHLLQQQEDNKDIREMVHRINAQTSLLLNLKSN